jgi:hypothetical protein
MAAERRTAVQTAAKDGRPQSGSVHSRRLQTGCPDNTDDRSRGLCTHDDCKPDDWSAAVWRAAVGRRDVRTAPHPCRGPHERADGTDGRPTDGWRASVKSTDNWRAAVESADGRRTTVESVDSRGTAVESADGRSTEGRTVQTAGVQMAEVYRGPDYPGPVDTDGGSTDTGRADERRPEARRASDRSAGVGAKQAVCSTELRSAACGGLHFGVQTSAFPCRGAHGGADVRTAARADVSIRRCHLVGDFTEVCSRGRSSAEVCTELRPSVLCGRAYCRGLWLGTDLCHVPPQ